MRVSTVKKAESKKGGARMGRRDWPARKTKAVEGAISGSGLDHI